MRQYELVLIIQPDLDEEATTAVIDRVKELITSNGGEIEKEDIWGARQLAYEIKDFREGFYVYMEVKFAPEFGVEFEQTMRYIEPIIRYLVTKVEA